MGGELERETLDVAAGLIDSERACDLWTTLLRHGRICKRIGKGFIDKGRILLIVAGPNVRPGSRIGRPGRSHSPVLCSWSPIPWLGDGYGIRGQDMKKTLQR